MTGAFSRRSFLAGTALSVASSCKSREGSAPPPDGSVSKAPPAEKAAGLTPTALAALGAATTRILPSDGDPGAAEAGCIDFIRNQLADPALASVAKELETLAKVLDVAARKAVPGKTFAALNGEQQDAILSNVQQRKVAAPKRFDTAHAFRVLVTFTLEGFLSDPRHGGNKGGVGWKFANFQAHAGHHGHHALPQVKP